MEWKLNKDKPLCPQICEQVCLKIALGEFKPNEKILSVREAALSAGVTPNTVQRAFETLEMQGILYSVRGSGWYVSEDTSLATLSLKKRLHQKTAEFFTEMAALGLGFEQTKKYIEEWNL